MNQQATIFGNKEHKKLSEKLIPGLKKGKQQKEEKAQIRICKYLRKDYPNVIFTCDLASGMNLPIHIAAKNKSMRSSRGLPDLFIAEPFGDPEEALYRDEKPFYCGLFIELKSEDTILYKKDGVTLRKKEHIEEQAEILRQLSEKGYKAVFAVGYEEAKKIIDEYLKK